MGRHLLDIAEPPRIFDVLVHVATLIVICIIFRRRIGKLTAVIARAVIGQRHEEHGEELRLVGMLIVASIITAGIGAVLSRLFVELPLPLVGGCFLITAGLLITAHVRMRMNSSSTFPVQQTVPSLGWMLVTAVAVGTAQGIAVLPGISRSGATIAVALLAGMSRRAAGEFSFLLSIPAILGALLFTLLDAPPAAPALSAQTMIVAGGAAFVAGLICLPLLLRLVRAGRLIWFTPYLVAIGILTIAVR